MNTTQVQFYGLLLAKTNTSVRNTLSHVIQGNITLEKCFKRLQNEILLEIYQRIRKACENGF